MNISSCFSIAFYFLLSTGSKIVGIVFKMLKIYSLRALPIEKPRDMLIFL